MRASACHGFTLIELSIVLVIIGQLVGGILVGRDLIRAAEIQGVVRQVAEVRTSVNTFRLKYNALAGDMLNATYYWGENNPDPVVCSTTARSGTATCNGTGDGMVVALAPPPHPDERLLFWEHLENASLIQQRIRGGETGDSPDSVPPEDVFLKAKLPGLYFSLYRGPGGGYAEYQGNNPTHYLLLGGAGGEDGWSINSTIVPIDAYRLDVKLDDGLPRSGLVTPVMIGARECHDGITPVNTYDILKITPFVDNCSLAIVAGF